MQYELLGNLHSHIHNYRDMALVPPFLIPYCCPFSINLLSHVQYCLRGCFKIVWNGNTYIFIQLVKYNGISQLLKG